MILIISEDKDLSTNAVIDWITAFNKKFIRINDSDSVTIEMNDNYQYKFTVQEKGTYELKSIKSFWYRRGIARLLRKNLNDDEQLIKEIDNHLSDELAVLSSSFIKKAHFSKTSLGNFFTSRLNKLRVLEIANSVGLKAPKTIITSNKAVLQEFLKEKRVITKSISDSLMAMVDDQLIIGYTSEVDFDLLDSLPDSFLPSLFQERLNKKYELRIFFIKEQFYAMAIFSQLDQKTTTDFRNYNYKRPNRVVPYKLPNEIAEKIAKLCQRIDVDCGSIDMIVDKTNSYYFLEINPVGQFGMVSYPCNYFLEKEVAKYLCQDE